MQSISATVKQGEQGGTDNGPQSDHERRAWPISFTAPPPSAKGPRYYGWGFSVRRSDDGASISRDGSLPGTATYLWRRADGQTWAVFFNQRSEGKRDGAIVDAMLKAL